MAINVNIDNQLALKYSFMIGGKKRELTFDDQCALDMDKVQFKVQKISDKVNRMQENVVNKKSTDEQVKMMSGLYKEIRNAIIPFFDKYFGDGQGTEIYQYFNESTRALATVFGKVNECLDKVEINTNTKKK
ncbi:hypothetical protein EGT49_03800 [Companilactobacillus suantsaicola]|uniref:Uncharacterized protein n=3 Tax=Companilactobacillus TaxID=2767879 RepID=A0A4Z0JPJ7_9LACO|nr:MULTISPECIES: hypothetical protein [Companilactobacillus]KRK90523.1 hypothetical protein FC88_GL001780 [Companilactobacillus futsaii JCM 17355]QCX24589.1 hypothetical protein FG051_05470 [Companilactobacillus futsaii]TGD24073.1 hypothetical protein EGT49_03800 [Companilactobacillus suantsaicola]